MAYQTKRNVIVAVKRETTTGTAPATVTGAIRVRVLDSPGLKQARANYRSGEVRTDGFAAQGRLGAKSVAGSYNTELTAGGATDLFLEAAMRSAWSTAVVIGFATMTSVSVGSNTIVANAGDWVGGQGIRVGDILTLTGTNTAGNNNKRAQVLAASSLTLTFATGIFTTGTAAAVTGTITRAKKLIAASTMTRYSHAISQYDVDTDLSELFLGCRLVGAQLSFKPGAPVTATWNFAGMSRTAYATGTSPFYTDPSVTTTLPLIADDCTIRFNGAAVTSFTGMDLNFSIGSETPACIGSLTPVDVFDGTALVGGTITGLRQDFSMLTLYDAETEFEIHMLLQEPSGTPPEFMSFFLPRVKIADVDAPVGGGDGAKVETLQLMIGPKVAATGYDATPVSISSSAA